VQGLDLFCDSMTPEVGITGTPVINPATNTMYVIVRTKETTGGNCHVCSAFACVGHRHGR
jgi:hypothetical protein